MSKHTPGPWTVSQKGTANPKEIMAGKLVVARAYLDPDANARLIAAAPDAVTLLQDLQEYLCEHGGAAVELLERVDAWLAKATGGEE